MANELQEFLAAATQKAANDLIAAVEGLPEAKRTWSPLDKGRSALDQAAECAILNGSTATLIQNRHWDTNYNMEAFFQEKAALATDWVRTRSLLEANTAGVITAIRQFPTDNLNDAIDMPWGKMTMSEILAYPYWNMTYHQGQTNYIGFIGAE